MGEACWVGEAWKLVTFGYITGKHQGGVHFREVLGVWVKPAGWVKPA